MSYSYKGFESPERFKLLIANIHHKMLHLVFYFSNWLFSRSDWSLAHFFYLLYGIWIPVGQIGCLSKFIFEVYSHDSQCNNDRTVATSSSTFALGALWVQFRRFLNVSEANVRAKAWNFMTRNSLPMHLRGERVAQWFSEEARSPRLRRLGGADSRKVQVIRVKFMHARNRVLVIK